MKIFEAVYTVLWVFTCATLVSLSCDKDNVGKSVCYLESSRFDEYQLGICVTNEYLEVYSNGKYLCEHHYPYCHLHCMLELHDILSGPVHGECRCKPDTLTRYKKPMLLPHFCYKPKPNDCSWFQKCVKLRYDCNNIDVSNAVGYVQDICKMSTNGVFNTLSTKSRKFINDIWQCLEVSLISILKPFKNETCLSIENEVFVSHSYCFSNQINTTSICSLPKEDVWKLFWTTVSSIRSKSDFVLPVIINHLETCPFATNMFEKEFYNDHLKKLIVYLTMNNRQSKVKRSTRDVVTEWFHGHYKDIVNTLALKQRWNQKGIIWYTIPLNKTKMNIPSKFQIELLITDQPKYDMKNTGRNSANLTKEIERIMHNIKNSGVEFKVHQYSVKILNLKVCHDIHCQTNKSVLGGTGNSDKEIAGCEVNGCLDKSAVVGGALGGGLLLVLSIAVILVTYKYRKRMKNIH